MKKLLLVLLVLSAGCAYTPDGWKTAEVENVRLVKDNLDVENQIITSTGIFLSLAYLEYRDNAFDKNESALKAIRSCRKYLEESLVDFETLLLNELALEVSPAEAWLGLLLYYCQSNQSE